MLSYEPAWRATQGARSYQEDTAIIWPGSELPDPAPGMLEPGHIIAVLADGMGGHAGGAIASRIACDCFVRAYADGRGSVPERLRTALEASNAAIARAVASNPALRGMGTTVVGAAFGPEGLHWVSVGDSPLWVYWKTHIHGVYHPYVSLLNADHSLGALLDKLAIEGEITFEQARNDPHRHMLCSAVTGEELELVDLSRRPWPIKPGDCVILASDGIHTLDHSEMKNIVESYGRHGPDAIAAALIQAVENARNPLQDNTTVVVVRVAAG
jgi:serine/threonine protein phosphatase PrpC